MLKGKTSPSFFFEANWVILLEALRLLLRIAGNSCKLYKQLSFVERLEYRSFLGLSIGMRFFIEYSVRVDV